jgi:hypothetical protein
MAEPPANAVPHLPGFPESEFSDFTHRDYRPDHQPNPTKSGVPYDPFMSPQKAGRLLIKVAAKSRGIKAKLKTKTVVSHGNKR